MTQDMEQLYTERLNRYVTAMKNGKPDRAPIRPFVAEFVAKYTDMTLQQVTQDYNMAFEATCRCAADFDWDAVVPNMVYNWAGLGQSMDTKYYAYPGVELPPDTAFQYLEPEEGKAWMQPDEYDALIADPTGYLFNVWLPRISGDIVAPGQLATMRSNMALVKGGMSMFGYFGAFGGQISRLRSESGTVSAISGILKAPFDIIADKLRGYTGLCMDMYRYPDKVLAACEAMAPHLLHVARTTADPERNLPVGLWLHRGCVPFLSPDQFEKFYWPTLKWIIESLWKDGIQTLFYAEGEWNPNLKYTAQLPEKSIVYHIDRGDINEVHRAVGEKFCISGGVPNDLLAFGSADDVRECCKKIFDEVGRDGGYIFDASAIMQNEPKVENIRAMTEFVREYAIY